MVAPFCGCLAGGGLYDLLMYDGTDSPINQPYLGFDRFFRPSRRVWSNTRRKENAV